MTHMPQMLNESGRGIPGLKQYTCLINLIAHFEMAVYAARIYPNRFTLLCAVDTYLVSQWKKSSNPPAGWR